MQGTHILRYGTPAIRPQHHLLHQQQQYSSNSAPTRSDDPRSAFLSTQAISVENNDNDGIFKKLMRKFGFADNSRAVSPLPPLLARVTF